MGYRNELHPSLNCEDTQEARFGGARRVKEEDVADFNQLRMQAHLRDIGAEFVRAQVKHPQPMVDGHHGFAILQEEVEEMWDAVKADDLLSARKEAVQVAAMALRFLMDVSPTL